MFLSGFVVCGFVSLFVNKITQKLMWTDFDEIFRICLKR